MKKCRVRSAECGVIRRKGTSADFDIHPAKSDISPSPKGWNVNSHGCKPTVRVFVGNNPKGVAPITTGRRFVPVRPLQGCLHPAINPRATARGYSRLIPFGDWDSQLRLSPQATARWYSHRVLFEDLKSSNDSSAGGAFCPMSSRERGTV